MKLTASPFDPQTGSLLPVYRDAYLRGDLSRQNTQAVDAYLKGNSHLADDTLRRFYDMKQQGEEVRPVGWVQRQFDLIKTEPERFRRRAASLVAGAALVGGAVFAGTNLPTHTNLPTENVPTFTADANTAVAEASAASSMRMVTVKGRILDENGNPLVGATVLQKGSFRGVSTDNNGNYSLSVPADQKATLQFGYAGYGEEELQVKGGATENVTLVPRDAEEKTSPTPTTRRRWRLF